MDKAKIIFNLEYRCTQYMNRRMTLQEGKKQVNTQDMYNYYDRDEACDKTICNTEKAFDYYDYRIGSEGGITNGGNPIDSKQAQKLCDQYRPEVIYRGVVSFDREFAFEQGIMEKKKMEKLVTKSMDQLLDNLGMKPENVIWASFYHTNTEHPHCHISFFEKVPTKRKRILSNVDQIRSVFVSKMEMNILLYVQKDERLHDLVNQVDKLCNCNSLSKSLNNANIEIKGLRNIAEKILKLDEVLPKQGSMKYNSKNIRPFHNQIREIIGEIYELETVKPYVEKYRDLLDELHKTQEELYGTGSENYIDDKGDLVHGVSQGKKKQSEYSRKQMYALETRIANMILQNIVRARMDEHSMQARPLSELNEKFISEETERKQFVLNKEETNELLNETVDISEQVEQKKRTSGKRMKKKGYFMRSKIIQYGVIREVSRSIQMAFYASVNERQRIQQATEKARQESYAMQR